MRKLIGLFVFLTFVGMQICFAQTREITGTVIDKNDKSPLPGVSVLIKGKSAVGTATDVNGKFSLKVNETDVLVFSFIGMKPQEIAVRGKKSLQIEMEPTTEALEEIVVIGYGSGKKIGTIVGSVTKISDDKLKARPSANAMDALQGQVAGLQVYTSSGEPSAASSVYLRGVGSLTAGNAPLYVLDGIPVTSNVMTTMNSNDFESITVLKDASATSIYGSRAANGVIYITTKKGKKSEKAILTASGQYGFSSLANKDICSPMNAKQLLDHQLKYNIISQEKYDEYSASGVDTKWVDYFFEKNVPTYQVNVDVTGGGEKTSYYISGSYFYQEGTAPMSDYERYTFRSNTDSQVKDWLRIGTNLSGSYSITRNSGYTYQGSNSLNGGIFGTILNPPYYNPYDEQGNKLDVIPGLNRYSPDFLLKKQPSSSNRALFNGMVYVELSPLKGLKIRSQAGMEAYDWRSTAKRLPSYPSSLGNGQTTERFARNVMRTITNTIEYSFDINELHKFTVLAAHEGVDSKYQEFGSRTSGQNDDRLTMLESGTTAQLLSKDYNDDSAYAYLSFFGRIDYSFNNKYFADFSVRNDASSRFGKDNRHATFYSGGLMWNVKNEDFMENANFLSTLKLKGSVGSTGNSSIGNYDHLALVGTSQYNTQSGWIVSSPGNPQLGWEKQVLSNVGLEVGFIENRYRLEFTYYNRKTKNMLIEVPVPYTSGFETIMQNIGEMTNSGVELTLGLDLVKNNDWFVGLTATYSYNKNKITKLFYGYQEWPMPAQTLTYKVGEPLQFYCAKYAGVDPADGAPMWYVPGTNETTKEYGDHLDQATGYTRYAPHSGGINVNARWKGLSVSADFSWVAGKYMLNNDRYFAENPAAFAGYNQSKRILNMWEKPGDKTDIPAFGHVMQFDTHLIEDASFMRLKNLTVSYEIPKNWLKRQNVINAVRVFANGRNLFTITDYMGADPELDTNLAYGAYPNSRQYSFGAEITF